MRKARIKQNRWDNWYGYVGTRRVIAFGNTPEGTAEDNAKAWLEDMKYAASVVHQWRKHLIDDKGKRLGIKALLRDPVLRRKLMIDCIIATQAREGIKTTQEQAEAASRDDDSLTSSTLRERRRGRGGAGGVRPPTSPPE